MLVSILTYNYLILNTVLALVGNKADMYISEEVTNDEGKSFAKEINAIYRRVSGKNKQEVEDLYKVIGNKFLNPNYKDDFIEKISIKLNKKLNKYVDY